MYYGCMYCESELLSVAHQSVKCLTVLRRGNFALFLKAFPEDWKIAEKLE